MSLIDHDARIFPEPIPLGIFVRSKASYEVWSPFGWDRDMVKSWAVMSGWSPETCSVRESGDALYPVLGLIWQVVNGV